jgi:hypothetical protein
LQFDRRKEKRQESNLKVGIFLSQGRNGPAITPSFQGQLVSFSRQGADIALDEIMYDRTHLALDPMGSDQLQFNIVLPSEEADDSFTIPAKPVWFDKKTGTGIPPFRIGIQFAESLTSKQLQMINRLIR